MYQGGDAGKILRFNPIHQTANGGELPPKITAGLIGNSKFEIKDFLDERKAGTNPLASGNKPGFYSERFPVPPLPCTNQKAGVAQSHHTCPVDITLPVGCFSPDLKYGTVVPEASGSEDSIRLLHKRVQVTTGVMPFKRPSAYPLSLNGKRSKHRR
jgi:hypothetical protein